jgi:hypothetical protein
MTKKKTLFLSIPEQPTEILPVKKEIKMPNNNLEVLITGSSRPQLFKYFYESFKRMCIIRNQPKIMMHEDFVFPSQSEKLCDIIRKNYPEIILDTDRQPRGLGWTLDHYLTNRLTSKYTFYLQEDWEFERPIDIDKLTWIMDENPDINLIFFNKIRNNGVINHQKQAEVEYNGYKFCVYHAWTMLPGIWRTSFVRKHFPRGADTKPESRLTQRFGSHEQRTPVDYCRQNIGAYIYGGHGEHRYIRHLGNNWRMASWQLEIVNGVRVPGGNHGEHMDKPYMAPWVPYPARPVQDKENT